MKAQAKKQHLFLLHWIKNDPETWSELRDIQIKILLARIVEAKTFTQISQEYNVPEEKLRLVFDAIIIRIGRCISGDLADTIKQVSLDYEIAENLPKVEAKISMN